MVCTTCNAGAMPVDRAMLLFLQLLQLQQALRQQWLRLVMLLPLLVVVVLVCSWV
jgi:hypothetical protein